MTDRTVDRIAIFGGTFDPPHTAHRDLISEINREFKFKKIIVVPSHYPPGKTAVASFEKRLQWTKETFKGLQSVEISAIEQATQETIFGEDVYRTLSMQNSQTQFYWILGEDQWLQLPFWKHIDAYGSKIIWIVMPRGKIPYSNSTIRSRRLKRGSVSYHLAKTALRQEISSSRIRDEILSDGESAEALKWVQESTKDDVIKTYRKQGGTF